MAAKTRPTHLVLSAGSFNTHYTPMLTPTEQAYFTRERKRLEDSYLTGKNPRQQSGFGLGALDWKRFRLPIANAIHKDGTFLDVGCANGLLMESVAAWTLQRGHAVEAFGLDISEELVELARRKHTHWHDRFFTGNALLWEPPMRFDFVRTELVYVPPTRRREYVERLLERFVAPGGKLLLCSYGSSRPEGARAEPLLDELTTWCIPVTDIEDVVSSEHGFVITRVITVEGRDQPNAKPASPSLRNHAGSGDPRSVASYIGTMVSLTIDRPLGSAHPRFDMIYPINYGFVPATQSGDGTELDAYVLGVDEPRTTFRGRCIAVIIRDDDDDPKLIVVQDGCQLSNDEIRSATHFQEQYFQSKILRGHLLSG